MSQKPSEEWWRPDRLDEGRYPLEGIVAAGAEGDSAFPFWSLMAFTFILLLAPQAFFPVLAPLRIALLATAVAVTTYLMDRFIHQQPIVRFSREMWIIVCLVSWAVLTLPFSYWPGGSLSFLLDLYLKTVVIFWLLSHTVRTPARLRQVAWALSLMSMYLAWHGVNQYLSGRFLAGATVKRIVGYEASLTGNPNDLALMLNLILPLSVALFLSARNIFVRIGLGSIVVWQAAAVIVTFSRAGFLTLATTFLIYSWKLRARPERCWVMAALVLSLLGAPFLPAGYLDRVATITDIESDSTGSAQARWNDTVAATIFVLANPIVGAGLGMNILALNEARGAAWKEVHNVYLEYAVDLGFPGLFLFLALMVTCIECTKFVQRRSAGVETRRELFCLAEGIQVSLIAFAIAALFYPVAYHFYFYYIAGLAIAAKAVCESASKRPAVEPNQLAAA